MQSNRGFSLIELLVVVMIIGTLSAISLPVLFSSSARNSVWTASEQVGSQIRQARLKAVSRNTAFRVVFNCPAANQYRVLMVDGTINDANRCTETVVVGNNTYDSGIMTLPPNVTFGNPPTLEVNGRGQYSIIGLGVLPLTITMSHGQGDVRTFTVSATGQITFGAF